MKYKIGDVVQTYFGGLDSLGLVIVEIVSLTSHGYRGKVLIKTINYPIGRNLWFCDSDVKREITAVKDLIALLL